MLDKTLNEILNEVDSTSPTPGGGAISALITSLSIALIKMAGHISSNRKSFKTLDEDLIKNFQFHFNNLSNFLNLAKQNIEKDEKSFLHFLSIYKLEAKTDAEKEIRAKKINESLKDSCAVIYELMQCIDNALASSILLKNNIVSSIYSDFIIGALYLKTSFESCKITLNANFSWLKDEKYQSDLLVKVKIIEKNIYDNFEKINI